MSSSDNITLARNYVTEKLETAFDKTEEDFQSLPNYEEVSSLLTDLIDVNSMGFRGVVATALTGMHLYPAYDPLNNFYGCSPRSIFENGIFFALQGVVPCGKSDPLNVAKNQNVLNKEWTLGKRPASAAQAAVDFLQIVVDNSQHRETLIDFYFFRLVQYGKKVKSLNITIPDSDDLSQQEIGHRLVNFVYNCPERGTTPQYVVSLLLKKVYQDSSYTVIGGEESVFGTNTTSKKPADIWVEKDKTPVNLYEITVKKVDIKRLTDSLHALNDMDLLDSNIHFMCRLPEDAMSLTGLMNGTYKHQGKNFNFIDLKSFILTTVSLLTTEQLDSLISELTSFIESIDRPISTKQAWNSIFS